MDTPGGKSEQVRSYFDKVAGEWDNIREGYFTEKVRDVALQKAGVSPDMVVADVGAGTGFMAAGLAPRTGTVICVDASPEMLKVAQGNLGEFDNVQFRVGDGTKLPIDDASVDSVFANMYLHHIEEPLLALSEMERVLKPGGKVVITDMDKHENEWMRAEMADLWLGFERPQVAGWFEAAGLVDVETDCTGQDCCGESSCGQRVEISVFVASGRKPKSS